MSRRLKRFLIGSAAFIFAMTLIAWMVNGPFGALQAAVGGVIVCVAVLQGLA